MGYDGARTYLGTGTVAAQNVISTASGAVVVGTTSLANIPTAEATYIVSIAAMPTGASTCGVVKPYVVVGTATSTGGAFTPAIVTSGTGALSLFNPPVAVAAGQGIVTLGVVSTGTASATQTLAALTLLVGIGPQFT